MSNQSSGASSGTRSDPAWKYCKKVDPNQPNRVQCNFCGKISNAGITRAKQHLIGGNRNVRICEQCPEIVREEIKQYMVQKEEIKSQKNLLLPTLNYEDFDMMEDETEDDIDQQPTPMRKRTSSAPSFEQSSKTKTPIPPKKPKQRGPIDSYFAIDPEIAVEQRKKGKQTVINEHYKKEARDKTCQAIARWMYDAGIPFNAVNYDSFAVMIEAIGQYGLGMKPPSYHEVRVPLLKKVEHTNTLLKTYREQWAKVGCSVMADGWKDRRERTLINFLVNSPKGTVFMESVDASKYIKTGEKMFELLDKFVQKVGPANVVQVVTDSASNNVFAGKLLETKYRHLFWTPCAAHCIDLMLEDIWKIPRLSVTMKKAVALSGFIYNHYGVLNMFRHFSNNREIYRPAKTRFATAFITLSSIYNHKACLRKMFTSEEWTNNQWAKLIQGKKMVQIVLSISFWRNVAYSLQLAGPLIKVIRLVDGEKKPPMGYIYEAMDRAKEAIAKSFNENEDKYKDVFQIIDRRWEVQLHRPLHAAGHYLNPEFFYANPDIAKDEEVANGLINCILRLVPDTNIQDKIQEEMAKYRNAEGLFGNEMAKRTRATRAPAEWWATFGAGAPHLQDFAIKVLGLTCSSSGCERNWSVFENLHSKRRNRLEHKRLNDLVFIKYNRALRRRYNYRDTIDPISLKEIDDSNEWLIGKVDEDRESSNGDEYVFEDEDLTWSDVARVSGVEEPSRPVRKSATRTLQSPSPSSNTTPTPRLKKGSFARSNPAVPLLGDIDEDEMESAGSEETEDEEEEVFQGNDNSSDDAPFCDENIVFDDDDREF